MTVASTNAFRRARLGLSLAVLALLALFATSSGSALAQTRVVALVNDEPITSYDVNARAKFISVVSSKSVNSALRAQALDELIDEQLKLQEAKRLGVQADQAAIDSAYAAIATRVKMTPEKLTAAFRSAGVNAETLKRRIEADVVWGQVVRQRFRQEVDVREQDIVQALGSSGKPSEEKTTEFELQKIIVILPKDPSNATVASRTKVAETFRSRFQNCAGTHDLTRQFEGIVWDRFGRKVLASFDEEDKKRLEETGENQVTRPRRTKNALEMYAVCSRREVEDDTAARMEAQSEIMNERGQVLARRLLIDLKQSAVIVRR